LERTFSTGASARIDLLGTIDAGNRYQGYALAEALVGARAIVARVGPTHRDTYGGYVPCRGNSAHPWRLQHQHRHGQSGCPDGSTPEGLLRYNPRVFFSSLSPYDIVLELTESFESSLSHSWPTGNIVIDDCLDMSPPVGSVKSLTVLFTNKSLFVGRFSFMTSLIFQLTGKTLYLPRVPRRVPVAQSVCGQSF